MSEKWWQKFRIRTGTIHVRQYPTDERFVCGLAVPLEVQPANMRIGMCLRCRQVFDQRHNVIVGIPRDR